MTPGHPSSVTSEEEDGIKHGTQEEGAAPDVIMGDAKLEEEITEEDMQWYRVPGS
jgi:hypothetical protein